MLPQTQFQASGSPGTVFEVPGDRSPSDLKNCEGKATLSQKDWLQDRYVTENSANDQVKWYYVKKIIIWTPSDQKINADMKQETTRTGMGRPAWR